jgi:tryptophanyl-tRNA synthetase
MTQFKDKSDQVKEGDKDAFISAGLFDYPVLQAADILIYKADYVPVGKDQEQHLELARNIATRFNNTVGKEYFVLPEAMFSEALKIRSLADPTKKMSKSLGEKHFISIFEEEKSLRKKVGSAVTDAGDEQERGIMSPGVENLFIMLKASGKEELHRHMMETYKDPAAKLSYKDLKEAVSDSLVAMTSAFTEKRKELIINKKEIKNQIKEAAANIRKIAQETLREVKELAGLQNVRF